MKNKILTALALFIVSLPFIACNNNDVKDGQWPAPEWNDVSYASKMINDVKYYTVPQEGGSYTFVCKNYGFSSVLLFCRYDLSKDIVLNTFDNVNYSGRRSITVTFAPNDTVTRYSKLDIQCGDAFSVFNFVQEGAK